MGPDGFACEAPASIAGGERICTIDLTLIRRFRNTMESGKLLYLQGDGPTICIDSDRRYGRLPAPIHSELTVAHEPAGSV